MRELSESAPETGSQGEAMKASNSRRGLPLTVSLEEEKQTAMLRSSSMEATIFSQGSGWGSFVAFGMNSSKTFSSEMNEGSERGGSTIDNQDGNTPGASLERSLDYL